MSNFINYLKSNQQLLFKKSSSLTDSQRKRKKTAWGQVVGLFIVLVQLVITVAFLALLFYLNIVPDKYMIILVAALLLISIYNIISQFCKAHIIGKLLSIFLAVVLFTGSLYVAKASSTLGALSGTSVKTDTIDVIVLNTSSASTLSDTKSYTFGYNAVLEKSNSEKAIDSINSDLNTTIKTSTYSDWATLINALYDGKVEVILLNDATRATLIEQYTDFDDRTKIIDTVSITTKVTLSTADKKVNEECFTIYVSGNDEYGDLTESGRSDVNIIATFNPKTRQVLLITTPRDYYIPLTYNNSTGLDKLTHAGNFGIDGSITALNNLYGIDIDYYLKVNFTGAVGIVDALDGITVNSEVAFTTCPDTAPIPYTFTVGNNECDGEKALAFCRERQVFTNGDNQRGRNQMIAIQGIISKATSPTILQNYSQILDSVSGMFATSMPTDNITSLIKGQLNNSTAWTVQSYNVSGTGGSKSSYFFGLTGMSVIIPDYNTVNIAIDLMSKITNGETFNVDEYVASIGGEVETHGEAINNSQTTTSSSHYSYTNTTAATDETVAEDTIINETTADTTQLTLPNTSANN